MTGEYVTQPARQAGLPPCSLSVTYSCLIFYTNLERLTNSFQRVITFLHFTSHRFAILQEFQIKYLCICMDYCLLVLMLIYQIHTSYINRAKTTYTFYFVLLFSCLQSIYIFHHVSIKKCIILCYILLYYHQKYWISVCTISQWSLVLYSNKTESQ